MLVVYLVTLALSSGLAGLMASQVAGTYGYVHGLQMSGLFAGGVACVFAALQLLYMATEQFLFPTRSRVPLFGESLSQLGALVLTPYLLHLPIPWPHPALQKVELFVFLGAFAAIHGFFKLVAFYGAIRGEAAGRLRTLPWLLCGMASVGGGIFLLLLWLRAAQQELPQAPAETASYQIGGQYATARSAPEGATIPFGWEPRAGTTFSLLVANAPHTNAVQDSKTDDGVERTSRVYITVAFDKKHYVTLPVSLSPDGWSEVRIPSDSIPEHAAQGVTYWESRKAPAWERFVHIRPAVPMNCRLLVAGPFVQQERKRTDEPNFVIVLVEGLGADHVSHLGYKRNTTPGLDRLAHSALSFTSAYTPAPDVAAAGMTLLTGVNPLRHGFLGQHAGPLAGGIQTLAEVLSARGYATAAFTEGETAGTGFERGFQWFDQSAPGPDADCAVSLEKARTWVGNHGDVKYLVFVRLRELGNPQWRERYAPGFAENAEHPTPIEAYDSAVSYVDRQLGAFTQAVRGSEPGKRTILVVTSSHGPDFFAGADAGPASGLSEASLRVPFVLSVPGVTKTERNDAIGLEDLVPTLLALDGAACQSVLDGTNLLPDRLSKSPISLCGSPLMLSIRFERWRFTWQSGRTPFTPGTPGADAVVALYDAQQARRQGDTFDVSAKHPDLTARLRARLNEYIK